MARIVHADERVACELNVNGERERVYVEPSRFLSDVLRDDLGLTGLKVACGAANCGACTVLVDGAPIYSCITLALDVEGRAITTIEGLFRHTTAGGGELHPVQRAFVEHDALQCGFCTSGQILTMSAFLEKKSALTDDHAQRTSGSERGHQSPTEDELRQAMSGNLCRCGAYVKILQAGMNLQREERVESEA